MARNGVITAKIATIEEYLGHLKTYLPVPYEDFRDNWGLQKIVERSLQVMIEAMIDVAERVLALHNLSPPKTSADAIKKLHELGTIKEHASYTRMVRFRNLVVHDYAAIDIELLYSILCNNLGDFIRFVKEINSCEKI